VLVPHHPFTLQQFPKALFWHVVPAAAPQVPVVLTGRVGAGPAADVVVEAGFEDEAGGLLVPHVPNSGWQPVPQ